MNVPHHGELNSIPLTFTAWIKTEQTFATVISIIVRKFIDNIPNGYAFYLHHGHLRAWCITDDANYVPNSLDGGFIVDGNWHHVAFVLDASGGRLYVDGAEAASQDWTGVPGVLTNSAPLMLASCNGCMSEVTLWNRALSQSELQDLMHAGPTGKESGMVAYWPLDEGSGNVAHDRTGHGHDGTLQNGPVWVAPDAQATR